MLKILVLVFLAVGALVWWVKIQERTAVFFPSREIHTDPGQRGLPFEEVRFWTDDGVTLHGWFVPGTNPNVLLWFHGNAGNIADRVDPLAAAYRQLGIGGLLFDFRGYGLSEGRPTEPGLYLDAAAAWRYLAQKRGIDTGRIVLYGHSLGTALALDLALGEGRNAAGLILESPFTSAREMAGRIYPFFPVGWLLSLRFDNVGRMGGLRMPLLVIHGQDDDTVPFAMGRRVFAAAPEPKTFLPVPGAGHSDCYVAGQGAYWGALERFLPP